MKKLMTFAVFAMIAVMVAGMIGTGAWFTDTATAEVASLSSATLSIDNGKVTSATLGTIENIVPGWVSDEVVLEIVNDGNTDLAWYGDLIPGESILRNVVYIKTAKMEFLSPLGEAWEPVDAFITNGVGSGDWPTVWGGPENLATLAAFDGNPTWGTNLYEFAGALKPGYKYRLTLAFGMYTGADNTYQHAGPLTIDFKVVATQINAQAITALTTIPFPDITWLNQQTAKQTMP